jgi:hypothetical protein
VRIAADTLTTALNDDPEFRLCGRLWSARIRYRMGDDAFILDIRHGRVAGVVEPAGIFDDFTIEIAAGEETWEKILAPVPPPFHHDLFPAQLHHGLRITGDLESVFAYYGALRRITELMRSVHNDAAVAA